MTKARVSVARRAALQVLGEVRRREARARDVLRASPHMERLDDRERALTTRLVMGVTGSLGLLDDIIGNHVTARSGMEPLVRDSLRASTYELLFLSTPESVCVSQGVELVRTVRPRAAGMANAILRRVAQEDVPMRAKALERARGHVASVKDLALCSGYPAWLLNDVRADHGDEACAAFALAALEPAPIYVAPNLARACPSKTQGLLAVAGLEPHVVGQADAFVLGKPAGLARSGLVQSVDVIPADESAQNIARLVVPANGGRLLEVGQGRGTKSLLMQNAARRQRCELFVTGVDSEEFKTKVAVRRMAAAGLSDRVRCVTLDARDLNGASAAAALGTHEPFDVVFVDAPCSGTGTLRRHPEIAWSLTSQGIDALTRLQLDMLCAAAGWVRPGGEIFYATCSVLNRENEGVVDTFLSCEQGASFGRPTLAWQAMPTLGGPDGHFCMRMHREG